MQKMWNLFDAESLSGVVEEIYTNRRRVTRSRDSVEIFSMFYSAIVIGKLGEALQPQNHQTFASFFSERC
jgi:hypothetical protein